MNYSKEQSRIIENATSTASNNIVVNACPGSGKSAVSIEICSRRASLGYSSLYITYSKDLKQETRSRIVDQSTVGQIHVHTIHSCVARMFGITCHESGALERWLASDMVPIHGFSDVDLLILDEAQDLGHNLIRAISRIRLYIGTHRVMVLGDYFQQIYGSLHRSTSQTLTLPHKHFPCQNPYWVFRLTTSFRITIPMATWINRFLNPSCIQQLYPETWEEFGADIKAMWGTGIRGRPGTESSKSVQHLSCNIFNSHRDHTISQTINRWSIMEHAQIMVLSHSVSFRSPASTFVRNLYLFGRQGYQNWFINKKQEAEQVPVHVQVGKARCSTIHSAKGLGRRFVMVLGFDSYLSRVAAYDIKNSPREHVLNAFRVAYVACTRASEELVVVSDTRKPGFYTAINSVYVPKVIRSYPYTRMVTEVSRNTDLLLMLEDFITFSDVCVLPRGPGYVSEFSKICLRGRMGTYESCSAIYGLLQEAVLGRILTKQEEAGIVRDREYWHSLIQRCIRTSIDNIQIRRQFGALDFKRHFDVHEHMNILYQSLRLLPQSILQCSVTRQAAVETSGGRVVLSGYADFTCRSPNGHTAVIELKCTKTLVFEHIVQAAVYGGLLKSTDIYILNPLVGKLVRIQLRKDIIPIILRYYNNKLL